MEIDEIRMRMHSERLYFCDSALLAAEQEQALEKLYDYNAPRPSQGARRQALLKEMFAEIGENCYIEPPLHANWGGKFVHFGSGVYANFNLTLVDDTEIYVGDSVMIGPNVTLATAAHPASPELRRKTAQYNRAIRIGANVWIGAGAILLPGVAVGENSIIGAGSVVTKSIPANVVAVGSPCRVLRPIGEKDRQFYEKNRLIDV